MLKPQPVILITCFLVFVAALAFPAPPVLLLATLLLALLYCCVGRGHLHSAWVMLRRMRWFLFSILFVYCWFTPGTPLIQWSLLNAWLPTAEGLSSGLQRVMALVLVIASVNLLLRSLSREQLLAAIYFLVRPLQVIGIKAEVVALRMILVFETMSEAQQMMSHHLPEKGRIPRQLDSIGLLAARVFHAVTERARQTKQREVILPAPETPPLIQWCLPMVLWIVLYFSRELWALSLYEVA